MVKIKISYEDEAERRAIMAALEPAIQAKALKGYKGEQPFKRAYITAEVKQGAQQCGPALKQPGQNFTC